MFGILLSFWDGPCLGAMLVLGGALISGRIVLCTFLRFQWLGGGGWGGGMLKFLELAHATHATPMLMFLELAHATHAMVLRAHALLAVGLPCAKHMVSEFSMLNIRVCQKASRCEAAQYTMHRPHVAPEFANRSGKGGAVSEKIFTYLYAWVSR